MKKLFKIILILVLVLVLLVAGVVFSPLLSISAKKSIEYFGSKTLKTEVSVSDVDIDVLGGKVTIEGLMVANPEGFEAPYAFKLNNISVDADMKSLKDDIIIIESIMIDAPEIVMEDMGANLKTLMANVENPAKTDDSGDADSKTKPAKQLVIADLTLMDATVNFEGVELSIPDINLKNLGTKEKTASIQEVVYEVINSVTAESLKAAVDKGKETIKDKFKSWF